LALFYLEKPKEARKRKGRGSLTTDLLFFTLKFYLKIRKEEKEKVIIMENPNKIVVCELCQDAILDELSQALRNEEGNISRAAILSAAVELGAEIPDHNCGAVEAPGTRCDCSCH
jgi:hypothetical protein